MIRIQPEMHRQLAIQAAEAGVSLNRLASAKLSRLTSSRFFTFYHFSLLPQHMLIQAT